MLGRVTNGALQYKVQHKILSKLPILSVVLVLFQVRQYATILISSSTAEALHGEERDVHASRAPQRGDALWRRRRRPLALPHRHGALAAGLEVDLAHLPQVVPHLL